MARIKFLPDDKEAEIERGETLLDAARKAGVYVGAICGGEGLCGKCRVVIKEGKVTDSSTEHLTREEVRAGYVLACQVSPLTDVTVEVPPESRIGGYREVGKGAERFRDFTHKAREAPRFALDPIVEKGYLELREPTLEDNTADQERVLDAICDGATAGCQMGFKVTRDLPQVLRELRKSRSRWQWDWVGKVTATRGLRGRVTEVIQVERGNTSDRLFAVAVDIGTTTVVAHLVDLVEGRTVEAAATYNSQIEFGADVITRINFARSAGGLEKLHEVVVADVNNLIDDLLNRSRVARSDVMLVVAAGNTTMIHLLLGLEVDLIRLSPFIQCTSEPPPYRAAEAGIRVNPRGLLYVLPMVGSYVGADITAGVLASGMYEKEELAIFFDIGTNGEVVLGNRDWLIACSASAGPAFEGGAIRYGMRATSGAIDKLRIFKDDLRTAVTTIDDAPPVGLCGTGLIDATAEMLRAGVIDRAGNFQTELAPDRFRDGEDGRPQFILVAAPETGHGQDVVLTSSDMENIVRTKGAIFAAADTLLNSLGLTIDAIERVYIAGGFGSRLNTSNCVTMGLLPDVPREKVTFLGNSSVAGAKMVARSKKALEDVNRIRGMITYRELMVDPSYMDRFTSACFLPHTDPERFPSVAAELERGKR